MSQFFFTQLLQSLRHRPSEDPAALRRPEGDGQAAQGLGKVRGHSDFFSKMFLTHHYVFKKSISLNKGLTERLPSQNQRWLIAQQGTDFAICFVCKGKGEGGVHQALLVDGGTLHRRPVRMGVLAFHKHRGTRVVHVMLRQKNGKGTLHHTTPSTLETVDDVPPSQLACLTSIPFTGAIKTPPTLPAGKGDMPRLRIVGIAGLRFSVTLWQCLWNLTFARVA